MIERWQTSSNPLGKSFDSLFCTYLMQAKLGVIFKRILICFERVAMDAIDNRYVLISDKDTKLGLHRRDR